MRIIIAILALGWLAGACSPQPQPIEYGADACAYCMMTIVDKQHAAEAVTAKGRAYKFDAIECMVNYVRSHPDTEMAFLLATPYTQPGELTPVDECTFLISRNIPSPMGAFLSAFPSVEAAGEMQAEKGGETYSWEALRAHFDKEGDHYFTTNPQK